MNQAMKYPAAKFWTVVNEKGEAVASKIKTAEDAHRLAAAHDLFDAAQRMADYAEVHGEMDEALEVSGILQALAKAKGGLK